MSLFEDASLIVTPNGRKAGKIYALKPFNGSGDLTVVRATTKTEVNASGVIVDVPINVPSFDYTNGSCPSILVEPQSTNLLLRSEEFNDNSWVKINTTVTANATTAPDGTTTADKLIPNTTSALHILESSLFSSVSGSSYIFSFYAKKSEYDFIQVSGSSALLPIRANFNLSNGTLGTVDSGITATITSIGNGWYRCTALFVATVTGSYRLVLCNITNSAAVRFQPFAGNGTSGLFVWGAQLEAGSNATSYIPTVASAVTRNADVISKTGISSLIGQTEGTIFANINIKTLGLIRSFISIQDASYAANALRIECTAFNQWRIQIRAASVTVLDQTFTSPTFIQGNYKIAFSYSTQTNGLAFYINGVLIYSTTISTLPTLPSRIYIGTRETSSSNDLFVNDSYNLISLFKTRLTNEQLSQLTTL